MLKRHSKGFTLIEMSIVLVIIGLIVGGILKGQELIESAREKNIITQLDQVRAAINTFEDKYQAFPGDFGGGISRIAPGAGFGDDNGVVGTSVADAATAATDDMNANENQIFWNHLLHADLIGGGVAIVGLTTVSTAAAVSTFGDGPLPEVAIPSAGLTMASIIHEGGATTAADNRTSHWVRINGFDSTPDPTAVFTPQQAAQLDIKTDDGIAYQGSTRTTLSGTGCGVSAADVDYAAQAGQAADVCFPLVELTR